MDREVDYSFGVPLRVGLSALSFAIVSPIPVEGRSMAKGYRLYPSRSPLQIGPLTTDNHQPTTHMPLTTGLRDEDNERINSILKRVMSLALVPDNSSQIDAALDGLNLTVEKLSGMASSEVISHLINQKIDWENLEQFADFLAISSPGKALEIYKYIQSGSKTFSFGIAGKIASAQKK